MSVRAFDLVPAFERLQVVGNEKTRMTIECIECCGKIMYIGTSEGFILQYVIEEIIQPNGKISCICTNKARKYLGVRKPIQEMKAASALNRILVNCDTTLSFLNMYDLEPVSTISRIKGITKFCVNENPLNNNPFSIQICVARRKQIMIYIISEDKAVHLKDVNLTEPAIEIAMDGLFVCVALTSQYVIVNCETNYVQDLFPYDSQTTVPLVKRISKEEFLLNGPNALGIFVTAAGVSERPPIQWMENVCSAAYFHPYILVTDLSYISIYSILDQQLKQNLQFQGGHYVGNFDGKIYATSQISTYILVPVPWEKQVQALLADERINEALELCKHSNKSGISKEQYVKIFQRIQQQAAFIHLSKFQFDEARELIVLSKLDIRELISLYPNLLPAAGTFTRSSPALHNIADINQMCRGQVELINDCKKFLVSVLEDIKSIGNNIEHQYETNIALLKLYAETDSPELTSLIVSLDPKSDCKEAIEWLEIHERYNAVGHLYQFFNDNENALQIWTKIVAGEYKDESFPGLGFLIEFLANLQDQDLVWTYADFVLSRDQIEGIKIFTDRPSEEIESEKMKPDIVVEFLHRYPQAILKYLEYLVFIRKIKKEKFHTHLAVLYLDNVLELLNNETSDSNEIEAARKKLRHLLISSSIYRVQLLLGKINDNKKMLLETALLYGKLEEHEKALQILVHELNDHRAAKKYCINNSEDKGRKYKRGLFYTLLSVYMDPKLSVDRQEELLVPAVQLLNSDAAEFDTTKVLQMIPDQWSVAVVERFLSRSLRSGLHLGRSMSLERNLSKCENLQVKFHRYDLVREPIIISEERSCDVCGCPFSESNFTQLPNGLTTHVHCAASTHFYKSKDKFGKKMINKNDCDR